MTTQATQDRPTVASIRAYWDERAASHRDSAEATTGDVHLRHLETRTLIRTIGRLDLPGAFTALDIGCGDGRTLVDVAGAFPDATFHGIDYSREMIETARRVARSCPVRVGFSVGDILDLDECDHPRPADLVTTDRCLINLPTLDDQRRALEAIAGRLRPGGVYLAIENFLEGHDAMNEARCAVGLDPIPVRWHNRFFREPEFADAAAPWFTEPVFEDFASAYYYATRVVYAAICRAQGEEPRYDHAAHRLAVDLPPHGRFSPVRLAILTRR